MDSPAGYLQVWFLVISYPNLFVICGMVLLFGAALLAPFHGVGSKESK